MGPYDILTGWKVMQCCSDPPFPKQLLRGTEKSLSSLLPSLPPR